jgi:hypothetical protein
MRLVKLVAIAGGILIAFLVVGSVIGFVIHAVMDLIIAALVIGAIVVAIKVARSGRQVSRKRASREVRDPDDYDRPLPRADVQRVSTQVPTRDAGRGVDVDEELDRLKREMGS